MQIQFPIPPGFEQPPFGLFDFVCFYAMTLEMVVLALPRKIGNWILETAFPILPRPLQ